MKKKLSVIIPSYNEEEAIPFFYKEMNKISNEMGELDFEFIFVYEFNIFSLIYLNNFHIDWNFPKYKN